MPFIPRDAAYIENRSIPEPNSGCWLWTAGLDPTGYGKMLFQGKCSTASRASFIIHGGVVPQGYEVDHICHTRACVNPEHLRVLTRSQNRALVRIPGGRNRASGHCWRGHIRVQTRSGGYCPVCSREASFRYKDRKRQAFAAVEA